MHKYGIGITVLFEYIVVQLITLKVTVEQTTDLSSTSIGGAHFNTYIHALGTHRATAP